MSGSHGRRPGARRAGLLALVLAGHAALALPLLADREQAPVLPDTPLLVDFVDPPKPPAEKPLPAARPRPPQPRPPRPKVPPVAPQPAQAEASPSLEPAPEAPPAPPAPPAPAVAAATAPADQPVTLASFDAGYLRNPAPRYPPAARRMGEEGKVVLRVRVSADGSAEQVEVRTSSGSVLLDEAARATVRRWKFVPARRGDTPMPSWVQVPIVFRLED